MSSSGIFVSFPGLDAAPPQVEGRTGFSKGLVRLTQCSLKTNHTSWKRNKCCNFGTQSNRVYRTIRSENILKQWATAWFPHCFGPCMSADWNTVTRERKAIVSICLPPLIHRTNKATSILESHKNSKYLLVKIEASHKKEENVKMQLQRNKKQRNRWSFMGVAGWNSNVLSVDLKQLTVSAHLRFTDSWFQSGRAQKRWILPPLVYLLRTLNEQLSDDPRGLHGW